MRKGSLLWQFAGWTLVILALHEVRSQTSNTIMTAPMNVMTTSTATTNSTKIIEEPMITVMTSTTAPIMTIMTSTTAPMAGTITTTALTSSSTAIKGPLSSFTATGTKTSKPNVPTSKVNAPTPGFTSTKGPLPSFTATETSIPNNSTPKVNASITTANSTTKAPMPSFTSTKGPLPSFTATKTSILNVSTSKVNASIPDVPTFKANASITNASTTKAPTPSSTSTKDTSNTTMTTKAPTSVTLTPKATTTITPTIKAPSAGPNISNITEVTNSSMIVHWKELSAKDANGPITGYEVCYEVSDSDSPNVIDCKLNNKPVNGSNNTMAKLDGLIGGTTYYVAVRASTSAGFGPLGKNTTEKTLVGKPSAGPIISNITGVTNRSMMVHWKELSAKNANGPITGYEVCYEVSGSSPNVIDCKLNNKAVNGSNNTMAKLNGLIGGTTYYVAVRASTLAGFGPLGKNTTEKTLVGKPSAGPIISNITGVTYRSMMVHWKELSAKDANGPITGYEVCYQVLDSSPKVIDCKLNKKTVSGGNNTMAKLDGLIGGTTYNVAVRASTSEGFGPLGKKTTEKTLVGTPSAGPNISNINGVTNSSMIVHWNELSAKDANGTITGYEVCYEVSDSSPKVIDCKLNNKTVSGGNNRMAKLDGLIGGTIYNVAVRASTSEGFGPLGENMTEKTLVGTPTAGPAIINITEVTETSMKVHWNKLSPEVTNGKIESYEVCYKASKFSSDIDCDKKRLFKGSDNRTNVLDGLYKGTTYNVAVKASTSAGFGPLGNITTNKTLDAKPSAGPNILKNTKVTNKTMTVSWDKLGIEDANGEITAYAVCYKASENSSDIDCKENRTVNNSTTRTVVLQGLNEGTNYNVAVKASTSKGFGPLGNIVTKKTLDAVPSAGPKISGVANVTATKIIVNWTMLKPEDANGVVTKYQVCYSQDTRIFDCTFNKSVDGNITTVMLDELNEATHYYIAVKAATSAGFGRLGTMITIKTREAVPAIGPAVKSISNIDSTSINIMWQTLTENQANGIIRKYAICYKVQSSSDHICSWNKTVGSVLSTNVTGLTAYTSYELAIRAATNVGFGEIGNTTIHKTEQDKPGKPTKLSANASFSEITCGWSKPNINTGPLTKYRVRWKLKDTILGDGNISNSTLQFLIKPLKPGTKYTILVSAFTMKGEGLADSVEEETLKSEVNGINLGGTQSGTVKDAKTQIGFMLPTLATTEINEIKFVQVIVKRWLPTDKGSNDGKKNLLEISQSKLTPYGNSSDGERPYIALEYPKYENKRQVIVGDDTSSRRKRRSDVTYRNAPLKDGTEYAIFVRVFYDDEHKFFQNSELLLKETIAKETTSEGPDAAVIAVVVVVVIVALLVVVFGFLLLRRRKARSDYNGIHLEPTAKPFVRYAIPIADFREHCDRLGMNTGLGYQEEYENVRPKGPVSTEIAKRDENLDKNRYNNIHAYDDSRVILSQIDGEEGSDYINANHIDGFERKNQFIAAQGTLKNTIVDFWRMIWEQKVSSIVMLANPIEKGREKLAVYWPQDRAVKHGPFMIKLDGEVELADYVIRKMTVTMDDVKETRQLTQFHYTVWPDHGVPQYTTSLQAFLTRIRKFVKADSNPFVVHCSAGVGRTGTFIGIFAMLDMIEATKTVDIYNFVCQMRTQRTHMVQVESQYVFLHKAVLEAIECGDTEINAPDLRVKMIQLNRTDPDNPDETMMEKQFKVLEKYTFIKSNTEEGKKPFNVDKNRNKSIIPYEDTRVSLLKSPGVDGSDYINASSIDSYQVRGMYIATQFPLENTVNEFWRMIWEKKSNCIVMLANVDEDPDAFKKYWTDKSNDAMLCGNLLVTLDNEEKSDEYITRNFKLKKNEGGETRDIWHFNFLAWTEEKMPKKTAGVRQMIGKIQDVQRQGGNNPIVVHCSDGGGRTGAFCALVTSLERVKQDQSFNLFQTIMLQRIQRPKMVTSVEQYRFCFQAILDFLDSFDQYANFQDLRQ
ncbi:receptor-type tyrosine-protein phosphatase F-like isoform X2 [Dendronephthya gigantea]|uniref:receptor-type tyrosine-protein phosphatase F-like isoform X2 n=1 Tax=Dendronephthya gigantea TaxID=151771 RepID=UPI00106AA4E0|nr:receptor-type tyrosine-protein phosphatase F-like isoform X2 [Dendronephthya gigantea]